MAKKKPVVWAQVEVRGATRPTPFTLLALTVDGTSIVGPGNFDDEAQFPVPTHLVVKRMDAFCAVVTTHASATAKLRFWSSALPDDRNTPVDERWKTVAETKVEANKEGLLEGPFRPEGEK